MIAAIKDYFSYESVPSNTPVNSYTIDGTRYTDLTEATKQDARDTATIQRQAKCLERISYAVFFAPRALISVLKVGQTCRSILSSGFSWEALTPSLVTVAIYLAMPAADKVARLAIGKWAKAKEAPMQQAVRQRLKTAAEGNSVQSQLPPTPTPLPTR